MQVTLENLRMLRATLVIHRLEHEKLVTQMQLLREKCREMRMEMARARLGQWEADAAIAQPISPLDRDAASADVA